MDIDKKLIQGLIFLKKSIINLRVLGTGPRTKTTDKNKHEKLTISHRNTRNN